RVKHLESDNRREARLILYYSLYLPQINLSLLEHARRQCHLRLAPRAALPDDPTILFLFLVGHPDLIFFCSGNRTPAQRRSGGPNGSEHRAYGNRKRVARALRIPKRRPRRVAL